MTERKPWVLSAVVLLLVTGCHPKSDSPAARISEKAQANYASRLVIEAPKPWTPQPSGLPASFVKAVQFAQAHGLPDPRECAFGRSSGWLMPGIERRRDLVGLGWILKPIGRTSWMFGIDGIPYEESPRRTPVDLRSLPVTALDVQTFAPVGGPAGMPPPEPPRKDMAAALFLIAGRADLAQHMVGPSEIGEGPILLDLAKGVLGGKWEMAVDSHLAMDDAGAARLSNEIVTYRPFYEAELKRLGVKTSALAYLDAAKDLLDDSQARLGKLTVGWADNRTAEAATVLQLVELTDQNVDSVRTHAMDTALAEALLAVVRGDSRRLSRASKSTDLGPGILTVREAAARRFAIVTEMALGLASQAITPSPASIERWWKLNQSIKPEERVYRVLADDTATPEQWARAAETISPSPEAGPGTTSLFLLRVHSNPSVAELMSRRIYALEKHAVVEAFGPAVRICKALWRWDQRASLEPLASLTDLVWSRDRAWLTRDPDAERSMLQLLEGRLAIGDRRALGLYRQVLGAWIKTTPWVMPNDLGVFYAYRDSPEFRGFAREAFLEPVLTHQAKNLAWTGDPLSVRAAGTVFIQLPEVREALLLLLADHTVVGSENTYTAGATPGNSLRSSVPMAVSRTTTVQLRRCDMAMRAIQGFGGTRGFLETWPTAKRDEAIAETIRLIKSGSFNVRPGVQAVGFRATGVDRGEDFPTPGTRQVPAVRLGFPVGS